MAAIFRSLPTVVLGLGLLAGLLALAAGPLYAADILGLGTVFTVGFFGALLLGFAALTLAFLWVLLAALKKTPVKRLAFTIAGSVIALAAIAGVGNFIATAGAHPLHDVTTDLANPPEFQILTPRNYGEAKSSNEGARKAAFPHPDWRTTHAEIYPDIEAKRYDLDPETLLDAAEEAGEALGWEIVGTRSDDQTVTFEAVATTGWFAFKDDIVIRIRPGEERGSVLDIRSVSRIGVSDVGANAARIRAFFSRLDEQLN